MPAEMVIVNLAPFLIPKKKGSLLTCVTVPIQLCTDPQESMKNLRGGRSRTCSIHLNVGMVSPCLWRHTFGGMWSWWSLEDCQQQVVTMTHLRMMRSSIALCRVDLHCRGLYVGFAFTGNDSPDLGGSTLNCEQGRQTLHLLCDIILLKTLIWSAHKSSCLHGFSNLPLYVVFRWLSWKFNSRQYVVKLLISAFAPINWHHICA